MGRFQYDHTDGVEFDDRVLAHLQIVITAKLRRRETFSMTFNEPRSSFGRTVLWMNDSLPLKFQYSGSRAPSINRAWVEELLDAANSPNGLVVLSEPSASGRVVVKQGRA